MPGSGTKRSFPCSAHRQGTGRQGEKMTFKANYQLGLCVPCTAPQSPGQPPQDQHRLPKWMTCPGHPLTQNPSLATSGFYNRKPKPLASHRGLRLTSFLRTHTIPSLCPLSSPYHQDDGCLFQGLFPHSLVQGLCLSPLYAQGHLALAWGLEQGMCSVATGRSFIIKTVCPRSYSVSHSCRQDAFTW